MKTAISIPDPIFHQAEEAAKRLGLTRSELYAKAVSQFVQDLEESSITTTLDRIYSEEDSRLDPALETMQASSLLGDE